MSITDINYGIFVNDQEFFTYLQQIGLLKIDSGDMIDNIIFDDVYDIDNDYYEYDYIHFKFSIKALKSYNKTSLLPQDSLLINLNTSIKKRQFFEFLRLMWKLNNFNNFAQQIFEPIYNIKGEAYETYNKILILSEEGSFNLEHLINFQVLDKMLQKIDLIDDFIVNVIKQVLKAMYYMHQQKIAHRNITTWTIYYSKKFSIWQFNHFTNGIDYKNVIDYYDIVGDDEFIPQQLLQIRKKQIVSFQQEQVKQNLLYNDLYGFVISIKKLIGNRILCKSYSILTKIEQIQNLQDLEMQLMQIQLTETQSTNSYALNISDQLKHSSNLKKEQRWKFSSRFYDDLSQNLQIQREKNWKTKIKNWRANMHFELYGWCCNQLTQFNQIYFKSMLPYERIYFYSYFIQNLIYKKHLEEAQVQIIYLIEIFNQQLNQNLLLKSKIDFNHFLFYFIMDQEQALSLFLDAISNYENGIIQKNKDYYQMLEIFQLKTFKKPEISIIKSQQVIIDLQIDPYRSIISLLKSIDFDSQTIYSIQFLKFIKEFLDEPYFQNFVKRKHILKFKSKYLAYLIRIQQLTQDQSLKQLIHQIFQGDTQLNYFEQQIKFRFITNDLEFLKKKIDKINDQKELNQLNYFKSIVCLKLGLFEQTLEIVENINNEELASNLAIIQAVALYFSGDYKLAGNIFLQIMETDPNNIQIQYFLNDLKKFKKISLIQEYYPISDQQLKEQDFTIISKEMIQFQQENYSDGVKTITQKINCSIQSKDYSRQEIAYLLGDLSNMLLCLKKINLAKTELKASQMLYLEIYQEQKQALIELITSFDFIFEQEIITPHLIQNCYFSFFSDFWLKELDIKPLKIKNTKEKQLRILKDNYLQRLRFLKTSKVQFYDKELYFQIFDKKKSQLTAFEEKEKNYASKINQIEETLIELIKQI